MSIKTAHAHGAGLDQAIAQIRNTLSSGPAPKVVVYFASTSFAPAAVAAGMQAAFPGAVTFGCSTAGEIVSGHMLNNSIVAMGFEPSMVEGIALEVLTGIKDDAAAAVEKAFASFGSKLGTKMVDLDPGKFVGLILADGMVGAEEKLMDRIGDLTNITFIGGSAGDDLQFKQTWVYANGKAHSNAAVLVVLKCARAFDVLKTQSFNVTDKRLVATKVNEATRQVIEFNGKPALLAYAEAVGTSAKAASDSFMRFPVGLLVDGEPYVRSPQRVEGNSIFFYCKIVEGMELALLESTDIVKDTAATLAAKVKKLGHVSGIINFHCILRTLELQAKNQLEAYGKVFSEIPTVGFSTYGEEYLGHINQTSTMLLFK